MENATNAMLVGQQAQTHDPGWWPLILPLLAIAYILWYACYKLSKKEPSGGVPGWLLPGGIIALILAVLGFLASASVGGGGDLFGSILAGLLNPFFFIGLPLGVYWLKRYAHRPPDTRAAPQVRTPLPEENNPRLTHCPDCGRHVSRLATTCPRCGRPLTPA